MFSVIKFTLIYFSVSSHIMRYFLPFFFCLFVSVQLQVEAKRRGGGNRDRAFETHRPGGIGPQQDAWGDEDDENEYNEADVPATQPQLLTPRQETEKQIDR